jgi:hypothetical protein
MSLNEWIAAIAGLTLLGSAVLIFWKMVHHS